MHTPSRVKSSLIMRYALRAVSFFGGEGGNHGKDEHLGWHFAVWHAMAWKVFGGILGAVYSSSEVVGLVVKRGKLDLLYAIDEFGLFDLTLGGNTIEVDHIGS